MKRLILILLQLCLAGCAAYQPGAALSMGECREVIRSLAAGATEGIALVKDGSYVFGSLDASGWRMVLAQPKAAGTLMANTSGLNYEEFLRALKENGWTNIAPGMVGTVARMFLNIVGDFLVVPLGVFEGIMPQAEVMQ